MAKGLGTVKVNPSKFTKSKVISTGKMAAMKGGTKAIATGKGVRAATAR